MADIFIHMHLDDAAQRKSQAGKRKKKNKRFQKKRKGYEEGTHKHFRQDSRRDHSTQRQDGASTKDSCSPTCTQNKSLPQLASTVGASPCSSRPSTSTHSMPSLKVTVNNNNVKPKEPVNTKPTAVTHKPGPSVSSSHIPTTTSVGIPTKYIAIDCEMVGVGPKGSISQLARCSIVSYEGDVVYDKFIVPPMPVTDYRTRWSGIRPSDLVKATPYSEARKEILKLLMGKVVIGHAIHNDFKVLNYAHPKALTRDTCRMPLLNLKAGFGETECASLKRLTKAIFNRDIQTGKRGHSSVEDAKATMDLYKVVEAEWERKLALDDSPVGAKLGQTTSK